MLWNDIVAHQKVKEHLTKSLDENRISHAQLFVGKEGYGTLAMALAYAKEVICRKKQDCEKRILHLQHPDLHFSFPTINIDKTKALSENYFQKFRDFILKNPYSDLEEWNNYLDVGNKQSVITVGEMEKIIESLAIKSFEGGYKVMIVWRAEKMNEEASNKFLKLLEEPTENTLFILITEKEQDLLPTITSRCQSLPFYPIEKETFIEKLSEKNISSEKAKELHQRTEGNWNEALRLCSDEIPNQKFEQLFALWTRSAFLAKKNPKQLKNIVNWSQEISAWGRENQKNFLHYCSEVFRQALLAHYGADELVFVQLNEEDFRFDKFSYYIHGNNIEDILEELNQAHYHIERNVNAKIVLLDLGIKLTRYIHRKAM